MSVVPIVVFVLRAYCLQLISRGPGMRSAKHLSGY